MYPLMPMLERGGKQGGGRCHNSAKTGIFKNSVSSLDPSDEVIFGTTTVLLYLSRRWRVC
jgi:hypothetical protein